MKKILMIHEWLPEFYYMKDELEKYTLTFDDGLVSQYNALEFLKTLRTTKIFFISTNIVRPQGKEPSDEITPCAEAHINAACGDKTDYMSWKEIKEIQNSPFCYVGGHGHSHLKLWEIKGLRERFAAIKRDTRAMMKTFKEQDIIIDSFCYPYNYYDGLLKGSLIKKDIKKFYDGSRTAIEDLKKDLK